MKIFILQFICFAFYFNTILAQNNLPLVLKSKECAWGLQDEELKKEVLPIQYSYITTTAIGKDWLIEAKEKTQTKYFLYQDGKVIPLAYPFVEKLNNRLLKVGDKDNYGMINTEGKGVLLVNYKNILPAGISTVLTILNQKYGAVAMDGKSILPNKFVQLSYWEMGGFWGMEQKTFQLYDLNGKIVQNAVYDAIKPSLPMPYCAVSKDGKWGIINSQNKILLPLEYEGMALLDGGLVAAMKGQKWQLMDEKGQNKSKEVYENVQNLNAKIILVTQKGKKGLLDQKGNVILEPIYQELQDVGGNWIAASTGEGFKIFDLNKKAFLSYQFEAVKFGKSQENWTGILFQKDKKWGWLDFNGSIIVNPTYTQVAPSVGSILVTGENQLVGLISFKGQPILPLEYKSISPYNGFFKVKKEIGTWFYVDKDNEIVGCI